MLIVWFAFRFVIPKPVDVEPPLMLALIAYEPAMALLVNADAAATPFASVVALVAGVLFAKVPLAPLIGAEKFTTTPVTGLPLRSVTFAWSTLANAELMVAIWPEPAVAKMFDGAFTVMSNAFETAPVKFVPEALSVYPLPSLSMDRLLKIAVPLVAETVFVPDSVPVDGLVPMLTVTAADELIRLFCPSSIWTVTAGVIIPFSGAFVGCCAKARCQA